MSNQAKTFLILNGEFYTYQDLKNRIEYYIQSLANYNILSRDVVLLSGKLDLNFFALMLSLIQKSTVVIPVSSSLEKSILSKYTSIAQPDYLIYVQDDGKLEVIKGSDGREAKINEKYSMLDNEPGLVLFTSGSSGEPKGVLHNFNQILDRYQQEGKSLVTYCFLLFDHIGGLNTVLYTIRNGGTLVYSDERKVDKIINSIKLNRVELLPTTPSFLNLVKISNLIDILKNSSLKIITYGTEPMSEELLEYLSSELPSIKFKQTYGSTEVGIMSTLSENSSTLWMKASAEQGIRIVDGELQVKTRAHMVTYLNAESPFTNDGWYKTGDQIIQEGDHFKIVGRINEIINIGGLKAHPSEVENILLSSSLVDDCKVYGLKNNILGQVVAADICLSGEGKKIEKDALVKVIKEHCSRNLERHKCPIIINFVDEIKVSQRFKKVRG